MPKFDFNRITQVFIPGYIGIPPNYKIRLRQLLERVTCMVNPSEKEDPPEDNPNNKKTIFVRPDKVKPNYDKNRRVGCWEVGIIDLIDIIEKNNPQPTLGVE